MSEIAAPFPYFGGKRRAASMIWAAFGDPGGYVEPFAGSAAVLLNRPAFTGRRVETINDADGWLVNAWRAIKLSPDVVAQHAVGPVTEIDYHARLAWLQERRNDGLVSWLEGDPEAHDAKAAAWWLYVAACGIGDPWGGGPWRVIDGQLRDGRKATPVRESNSPPGIAEVPAVGVNRELPHLGNAGQGIHRALPHLGDAGQGIHRALPHLGDARRGEHLEALTAYMLQLAWRLERVRITCGDWQRVVKPSASRPTTGGDGSRAILLDPPYATSGDLYAGTTDTSVANQVADWCKAAPSDLRIALCGYNDEHDALLAHGWRKAEGKAGRGAGYSVDAAAGRRERIWFSPACLDDSQLDLFGGVA